MNKFLTTTTITTMLFTNLMGLTLDQENVIKSGYNIGKQIKAKDGMTFENTTASISITESSAGLNIIGDEHHSKKLRLASLGAYQIRLVTAKEIITKDKQMNKYYGYLLQPNRENHLITLLLTNIEFSAMIAATYIKMNYNRALKNGHGNPLYYAISKYNGGSRNTPYYKRVIKNMKISKTVTIH